MTPTDTEISVDNKTLKIRNAETEDLSSLVDIYNHYVVTSYATFDTYPRTVEDRWEWFDTFSSAGPHQLLVATLVDRVVGYAYSAKFRERPAYRTSVETSIYLGPEFTGRGIGNELYGSLLDRLVRCEDVHQAYAGVVVPNPGSVALHEHLGFEFIGTFREVGHKFGKFWGVSWYQKTC